MVKKCIVETQRGIKLGAGRVINPNVPIELSGRDIFALFKKSGVKVYELLDNSEKIQLTPGNYLDDNSGVTVEAEAAVKVEEVPVETVVEHVVEEAPVQEVVEETPAETTEEVSTEEVEAPAEESVEEPVAEEVKVEKVDTKPQQQPYKKKK